MLPMLALLLPFFGIWGMVVIVARHQLVDVRAHQAQIQAVLAVAKEGMNVPEPVIAVLTQAYLRTNLGALTDDAASMAATQSKRVDEPDPDRENIAMNYTWRPWFKTDGSSTTFSDYLSYFSQSTVNVSAERFYRPMEIAIVLDASLSLGVDDIRNIRAGVTTYIDRTFRNQAKAKDTWISLVSYASMVNIGWKYKDKLITPESRRIPPELYSVARENGWFQNNDLLDPKGVEGWRQGACVARHPLNGMTPEQYAAQVQIPPDDPQRGFDLVLGRNFENIFGGGFPKARELFDTDSFDLDAFNRMWIFSAYGLDVPPQNTIVQHPRNESYPANQVVATAWDCGNMPLLVASDNRQELTRRLKQYVPTWRTGGDEGLAWGFRALSPDWQRIWQTGAAPFPYSPLREKKLILITDGGNNAGYGIFNRHGNPNAIPALCKAMRNRGIEVSVMMFGVINYYPEAIEETRACATNPDTNYFLKNDSSTLTENLIALSARQYRVRLAP